MQRPQCDHIEGGVQCTRRPHIGPMCCFHREKRGAPPAICAYVGRKGEQCTAKASTNLDGFDRCRAHENSRAHVECTHFAICHTYTNSARQLCKKCAVRTWRALRRERENTTPQSPDTESSTS